MVLNLDRDNTGYINGRDLSTYICLLNAPLPS